MSPVVGWSFIANCVSFLTIDAVAECSTIGAFRSIKNITWLLMVFLGLTIIELTLFITWRLSSNPLLVAISGLFLSSVVGSGLGLARSWRIGWYAAELTLQEISLRRGLRPEGPWFMTNQVFLPRRQLERLNGQAWGEAVAALAPTGGYTDSDRRGAAQTLGSVACWFLVAEILLLGGGIVAFKLGTPDNIGDTLFYLLGGFVFSGALSFLLGIYPLGELYRRST